MGCCCLEVCIELEVVQGACESSHDTRLLVLAHTLLKEVGLTPVEWWWWEW